MAKTDVVVRLCELTDLPVLRVRERHPAASLSDKHFSLQQQGNYLFAVAFIGDEPAGTGVMDLREGPLTPELKSLWVYPALRRRGAGRALTTFLEAHASELGYEEVFFGVDPDNYEAIPMYLDLGYSPTGNHREAEYVWVDDDGAAHTRLQVDAIYRKSLMYEPR